jgi:hypothetical protein
VPEILDLPAEHSHHSPVFVIGVGRSGTSLTCTLIRRYLRVNFGTESQFIIRTYKRLPLYGDLETPANLKRLVTDIARERCFERWTSRFGFVLDVNRVVDDALRARSYAGVLHAIFHQFARYHGMSRWGDKTPEYNHNLPVLLSLFPDAQFIHIVRDGRDVALSTFRMGFGATNVYRAAASWRHDELQIQHFAATLPQTQLTTIRYERLISHPLETIERLSAFLGIREDTALRTGIAADIRTQVRAANSGKWRTQMSVADQRLFEQVAGDVLQASGYPTLHDATAGVGALSRAFWFADHLVKKTIRPKYWSDNVYKARLRLRMARGALSSSRATPA